jgi:hypothetical protein
MQAYIYWQQSKLMAKQAKLTREAIDGSKESSERQLRAYVNVSESKQIAVVMRTDYKQFCDIVIKNSGQTPAYDLIAVGEFHGHWPIGQDIITPPINRSEYRGGKSVLNPQSEIILQCKRKEMEYPPRPAPNGATMYVYGRIEYRDAFGKDRFTNFCFALGKEGPRHIDEAIAHTFFHVRTEKGNDAD